MKKNILTLLLVSLYSICTSQVNTPVTVVSGLPDQIYAFDIHGNYIYYTKIAGANKHVGRVNYVLPNSTNEVLINNNFPIGLTIHNNVLYYGELYPARISKIDLTQNPLVSTPLPVTFTSDFPWGIKVFENELHFSESTSNLKKVPLNNLAQSPITISQFPHQYDFIKEGSFYYSTSFDDDQVNNIFKFNFSNSASPVFVNVAQIFEPTSIAIIDNQLFVGTNDNKIYKINLLQPNATPVLFYEVTDETSILGKILAFNNELYFSYNQGTATSQTFEGKIMKFGQSQLSNEDFFVENIKVFPNPASNVLSVATNDKIEKIDFYDILGKKVAVARIDEKSFDTSTLSKGVYRITMQMENNRMSTVKLLKD